MGQHTKGLGSATLWDLQGIPWILWDSQSLADLWDALAQGVPPGISGFIAHPHPAPKIKVQRNQVLHQSTGAILGVFLREQGENHGISEGVGLGGTWKLPVLSGVWVPCPILCFCVHTPHCIRGFMGISTLTETFLHLPTL